MATSYQKAIQNLERANEIASLDHPRYPAVWVMVACATIHALLSISDAITAISDHQEFEDARRELLASRGD